MKALPLPADVTGVILAGGRGVRVGGADKGLLEWRGRPLVQWQADALRPQAGALLVSANRNHERYRALGFEVVADDAPGYPGPLAGMLAALRAARTGWIACVPCDTANLPADAVARLLQAALAGGGPGLAGGRAAHARCGADPYYPLCVLHASVADDLAAALQAGRGGVRDFLRGCAAGVADLPGLRNLNDAAALAAA